jgi:hypothetical protein
VALTTYRSLVPITTQPRKDAAYEKAALLFSHAGPLGVDVLRIQYMQATQYIEVDFSDPIAPTQATHLGLEIKP